MFKIYFVTPTDNKGGNALTKAAEGAKNNIAKASAVTQPSNVGGTAVTAADEEGEKIIKKADSLDPDERREGELMAKGLQAEQDAGQIVNNYNDSILGKSTPETRKQALETLDKIDPTAHYKGDKEVADARATMNASKADYETKAKNAFDEVDRLSEAEAAANASDFANEIAQHDITTEEGKAAVENYLQQYKGMLDKYTDEYNKSYNKALLFNAISSGIAQATGVPAIDFTKHPKVTEAKAWVDRVDSVLQNEKATAGAYGKAALENKISKREEQYKSKKAKAMVEADTAKQILDQDVNAYGATNLSNQMTKLNMDKVAGELGLGIEGYEPRIEEAKIGAREKATTGTTLPERFAKGMGDLVQSAPGMIPDLVKIGAKVF